MSRKQINAIHEGLQANRMEQINEFDTNRLAVGLELELTKPYSIAKVRKNEYSKMEKLDKFVDQGFMEEEDNIQSDEIYYSFKKGVVFKLIKQTTQQVDYLNHTFKGYLCDIYYKGKKVYSNDFIPEIQFQQMNLRVIHVN